MWETWVQSLSWEDPLEKGKTTHARLSDFHFHFQRFNPSLSRAWTSSSHMSKHVLKVAESTKIWETEKKKMRTKHSKEVIQKRNISSTSRRLLQPSKVLLLYSQLVGVLSCG